MAQVLCVAALQVRDPVLLLVLMEPDYLAARSTGSHAQMDVTPGPVLRQP